MKKYILTSLFLFAQAGAAPFVYPASWFESIPSERKRGGTMRVPQWIDYKTFNPFISNEVDSVSDQLSSGASLFMLDPTTKEYIPLMAKDMPIILNNGKRFIVNIRPSMRFSDGKPITADDFVTTYNIHSDKSVGSEYLRMLFMGNDKVTIKKLGKLTLQFDMPYKTASAYEKMSLAPWPAHVFGPVYKKSGANGIKTMWGLNTPPEKLVSPGAWKLQTFLPNQKALFAKNPYFGKWSKDSQGSDLPYFSFLSRKILPAEAELIDYVAGNQDFIEPRKASDLVAIQKAITNKNLNAKLIPNVTPHNRVFFITFNWNKEKDLKKQTLFRNAKFRKAMSHFVNRKAMIQLALGGTGTASYSSVSPTFKKYKFKSTPKYPYDPQKGLTLLKELGYSKKNSKGFLVNSQGEEISFNIATMDDPVYERMTRIFSDELAKVGVRSKVHVLTLPIIVNLLLSEGKNRNWDAIMLSVSGFKASFPYLAAHMICGSSNHAYNRLGEGKCLDPKETKVANLFKIGESTLDTAKRQKIGEQISKIDADLQAFIYLASPNYHISYNKRIGGWYKKEYMDSINGPSPHGYITNFFQ